jgi:hypothetical protein
VTSAFSAKAQKDREDAKKAVCYLYLTATIIALVETTPVSILPPVSPGTGANDRDCLNIQLCPDPTVDDVEWKSRSLDTIVPPHSEQSVESGHSDA